MRNEFRTYVLGAQDRETLNGIGEIFSEALTKLESLVPQGRSRALMVTKLQEADIWAKRGVAEALPEGQVE